MEDLEEWSTNFDAENVEPFLRRIVPHIEAGFGDNEIRRVTQLIEGMDVNDEEQLVFKIRYSGAPSDFKVGVFMDDIDAPEYFFAPPALCEQLSAEMQKFAAELGI